MICGQKSEEDLDEMIKTFNKDKKYCHKAYKKNKDVILVSTDQQIKKYVKDNKKIINNAMKKFTKSNKLYKYKIANDYSSIQLYFDEKISEDVYYQLLSASINFTSLNSILLNCKDWHLTWQVINCHTNKTVVTWNLQMMKKIVLQQRIGNKVMNNIKNDCFLKQNLILLLWRSLSSTIR